MADETNPAAWTLVSATAVTGLGQGNQTLVNVTPFNLLAGTTYGIYITIDTPNATPTMFYTDNASTTANADLSLSLGLGEGGVFGTRGLFANRTWNGAITYAALGSSVPEPGSLCLCAFAIPAGLFLRRRKSLLA